MKRLASLLLLCCIAVQLFSQPALPADDGRTIHIPVVVHVIYNREATKPTLANIQADLKNLHDDFLGLNADKNNVANQFLAIIGNPKISFDLATNYPGSTNGIFWVKSLLNRWQLYKRSPIANAQKYLNIYIGNLYGKAGFSYSDHVWDYPETDAVYVDYAEVGNERLFTHEVGHWLGLPHIYGGKGGSEGDDCKLCDEIPDTPEQRNATGFGACPPNSKDELANRCNSIKPTNYNNFMDYSSCRYMFTQGQVTRMRHILQTERTTLWNN